MSEYNGKNIDKAGSSENISIADLYEKYLKDIQRFVRFRVSDTTASEDIVSEVFLGIIEYLRNGKNVRNIRAFLYRSARNALVDYYKAKAKITEYEHHDEEQAPKVITLERTSPGGRAIDIEIAFNKINESLPKIKREYQEIIRLRFVEELELDEIAIILNKTSVGVRVLLHRAIKALRKILQEHEGKL